MKKIPSLFIRDYEHHIVGIDETRHNYRYGEGRFLATHEVTPGCEWVINGEGIATRKWDGIAILVSGGSAYRRYDAKHGKTPPEGFLPCQDPDPVTGHWLGWVRINHMSDKGQDKWIWEAVFNTFPGGYTNGKDGTYEAIGPRINGNKEKWDIHQLIKHGESELLHEVIRTFEGIKEFLTWLEMEGIVFHHPDGRMCKVKRSDFGLKW
jgi:hypothetical protein